MEIVSNGVKDDSQQEEVNEKTEKFIKDKEEKILFFKLFILECQYYKK